MTTLAERDRESIEEFSHMKTDRIAALEAERDALKALVEQLRGLYQVTHIHAAIDAARSKP